MSNDTIPKVIFVVAIIICIIILLLKPSTPSINQEPKTPEKFIKNFNSKVQSSSENTKLNKIRLETNYNNFINSANQTPILIGNYSSNIEIPVNLKIKNIVLYYLNM